MPHLFSKFTAKKDMSVGFNNISTMNASNVITYSPFLQVLSGWKDILCSSPKEHPNLRLDHKFMNIIP